MPTDRLTELESCTLGVIRQHQPCSTYKVRSIFAASHTTEWSASAGSLYPVIERLQRLKLVKLARAEGGRGRRDLSLTLKGERALQSWMLELQEWTARATPDPIRTRSCFIEFLPSLEQRAEFLEQAEALTRAMIGELETALAAVAAKRDADYFSMLGAHYQLEARLRWLGALRAAGPPA